MVDSFPREGPFGSSWIACLKLSDGNRLGKSSYNTCKSALCHLFRIYNAAFPADMDKQLKEMHTGLKKTVVKRKEEVKKPLILEKIIWNFHF